MNPLELREHAMRQEGLESERKAFAVVKKHPGVLDVTKTPRGFYYDGDIIFKSSFPVLHDAKLEVKSSQDFVDQFLTEKMVREFQLKDPQESMAWRLANRLIILNAGEHRAEEDIFRSFQNQLDEIIAYYQSFRMGPYHRQVK